MKLTFWRSFFVDFTRLSSYQKSISGSNVDEQQPVTNLSSSNAEIKPKSIVPKIHPVDDDDFNDEAAQAKIRKYFDR